MKLCDLRGCRLYYAYILVFCFTIYIPLFGMIILPSETVSALEKRKLAEFPAFGLETIDAFPKSFETFFADHLGFRDLFTLVNSGIKILAFQKSPVDWMLPGKDGWLYYTGESSMDDVLGKASLKQAELEKWRISLQGKSNWLNRQGIRYFFMIAPDKQTIYPEYLPDYIQSRHAPQKRLDQFLSHMQDRSDVPILDVRADLTAAKKNHQIYYRTDTHWNWSGGWIAYQKMMERIAGWFPFVTPISPNRVNVADMPYKHGDLTMGWGWMMGEREMARWVTQPCQANPVPRLNERSFEKKCPGTKLRAIVWRDSFLMLIEPFLSESFNQVIYVWQPNYDHHLMKQLVAEIQPDLVIEERIERSLGAAPELTLEERFDYSSITAFSQNRDTGHADILANWEVKLEHGKDGLLIHATGEDPSILLPPVTGSSLPLFLHIHLWSPDDTVMQVFYPTGVDRAYQEDMSIACPVRQGDNHLYLEIDKTFPSGRFRLDPGGLKGNYLIQAVEMRTG